MNILYLHALKSKLNGLKREVLEKYGKGYAPDIDYSRDHIQPLQILQNYPDIEFNVIIGSSMGALNGYIISDWIGPPALIFNPPLSKHPENIDLPKEKFIRIDSSKESNSFFLDLILQDFT